MSQNNVQPLNSDYASKPDGYYGGERQEILQLIPATTKTLLDIGCGEGRLGAAAKQMLDLDFTAGVELFEEAAMQARMLLDDVLHINIEQSELPYADGKFDCIICADVLEHMIDPWAVLIKLRRVLSPGGVLIASIPNIAHSSVVRKIIRDRFEYESSGLLDRTHLRFFTLHTIQSMFTECGYMIEKVDRNINRSQNFFVKYANIWMFGLMREKDTFQFLITASRSKL